MQRARESSEINEASRYQLGYPPATPLPAAQSPSERLKRVSLRVFCSIFLGFFLAILILLQLLLLLRLLLFFGVQLVRHERADSASKDINSYGSRKGTRHGG